MVEPPDRPRSSSPEALFRYLVLGQVEALIGTNWPVGGAVRAVARRDHVQLDGTVRRVSTRTIRRWRKAWLEGGGLDAVEPAKRTRTQTSVVLLPELLDFMRSEKELDPRASIPELLRRARVRSVIPVDLPVDRTTAWRACRRMGLATRIRPSKSEGDTRRFSYPNRMRCVLADGKHFRAGATKLKRVALFFLDDCTRYALHVVVGTSESTTLFLRGLHGLVERHGLMGLLYLDKGPGFRSDDTLVVVEKGLGAWLVHGKTAYPEGHGKVERFNRTAWDQMLRGLTGAHVDPTCAALELRLRHWLGSYNDTPHESLGQDTPRQRWEVDPTPLRFPRDLDDLRRRFVVKESRKVSKDHVIKHGGLLWEAPRGLADRSVEVHRNALDGELLVVHRGRLVRLHELDPHANATAPRAGYPDDDRPLTGEGVPNTAADAAFHRDMGPIVGPDGGFTDPEEE